MAFAIIQNGGKQYKVAVGETVSLEKIDQEEGKVTFSFVVLTTDGENTVIGEPFIKGALVEGNIVEQGRADKIRVVHRKAKKRMMKVRGHRQPFTKVLITKI
ncbi:TPA: 50S ribosomal protein L21 [Candidatus Gracilibacteria bacterium]|nr:50S ribosomal protein L21 [Candidatus Gracilibacteria bacterium]HIQ57306.1 50S ribosomal protein L21 [Candidatus Gracilibacteria bacterium]